MLVGTLFFPSLQQRATVENRRHTRVTECRKANRDSLCEAQFRHYITPIRSRLTRSLDEEILWRAKNAK